MITLHIENTIADYDAWKAAFDRYDRARRDHHVLAYRISRPVDDPARVFIDLDFDTHDDAAAFVQILEKIWQTPLSAAVSSAHTAPELRTVAEQQLVATEV
ncbi:hypothetical protein [Kribbella speibonae]|uniref:Cyclase n=1 Tax=Kribbella speibonae TaxID=1572660 RepID=A0ABY1ZW18_9ACTN|nr:hypothetical protein [Kribbella speibonae]TCC17414.1 hypothetical protein E0H58_37235 [Kribbella speibonae]